MINQQDIIYQEARKLLGNQLSMGNIIEDIHAYTQQDGAPLYWRLRIKKRAGGKSIFPMSKAEDGSFVLKEPDFIEDKKTLYRLHELLTSNSDEVVYVVEGEKCADALISMGLLATTSGGSSSAQQADWSPLAGRTVILWRDFDKAGLSYAIKVTEILLTLDCKVKWINVEALNLLEGGDCVDWINVTNNRTGEDVQRLPLIDPNIQYPRFEVYSDGVYYCKDRDDAQWLSSRLVVIALTRDSDGINWGRVLEFIDADQVARRWTMPMELLGGNGDELARELLRLGLRIAPGVPIRKLLIEYITNSETNERARCVLRTGWHDRYFVLPHKVFGSGKEIVLLQSDNLINSGYNSSGALEDWQKNVAVLCTGNSRLIFSVSLAFASPLLKIVDAESGGFHFRGESSTGKTTTLIVGASVWGGRDYIQNWRATDNGLEGLAVQHNETFLPLDEISQIDPKYAGETAYMLANGQGKVRASKSGNTRPRFKWRLLFLSNGEISLSSHMLEAGKKSKAGQEVRMVDIPADAGKERGIFETLHSFADGAVFSEQLKMNCEKHHGVAGEAWLEQLVRADHLALHTKIQNIQHTFLNSLPEAAHGQLKRVAQRFALVAAAGELASEYGITGWEQGVAIDAAKKCFKSWLDAREAGTGSHEMQNTLDQVQHFFQKNAARFDTFESTGRYLNGITPQNCIGYSANNGDFYVFPKTFTDEMCKGIGSPKDVIKIITNKGWLLIDEKNIKPYKSVWVSTQEKMMRLYHFSSNVMGESKSS